MATMVIRHLYHNRDEVTVAVIRFVKLIFVYKTVKLGENGRVFAG